MRMPATTLPSTAPASTGSIFRPSRRADRMRILRSADHREMPWKNGQGATREILVHPEGASLDGFMWRISMAQVNAPGAFSVFPGCDRILCVVNGGPLLLAVEDAEPVRLGVDSPPFHFAADAA